MAEWYLFLVAIGFLVLAMSPTLGNSKLAIVIGILLIVIGGFIYQRQKKSQ